MSVTMKWAIEQAIAARSTRSDTPDGYYETKLPQGSRRTRAELRLVVEAVKQHLLGESRRSYYTNIVRRVPRITSQAKASTAINRFYEAAEWASADEGEAHGEVYRDAAWLADRLLDDYNGWPSNASYGEVAEYFVGIVYPYIDDSVVRDLLAALEKVKG